MIYGVSGHRSSEDLCYTYIDEAEQLTLFAYQWLDEVASPRPTQVLVGMADGWDYAVASACVDLNIPFTAVLPWPSFGSVASRRLLSAASAVRVEGTDTQIGRAWTFHARNRWIVEHCDHLLVMWDRRDYGGTYTTKLYAEKTGKPVTNLAADWLAWRPTI